MKRALVPGVLVLLLALAGCSGGETTGEQAEATPAATTAQADAGGTDAAKPLSAESPAVAEDAEAAFLDKVRADLRPDNVIPNATDDQLLAAGREACERRASGESSETISVIDGEPQSGLGLYVDSGVIITAARSTICGD